MRDVAKVSAGSVVNFWNSFRIYVARFFGRFSVIDFTRTRNIWKVCSMDRDLDDLFGNCWKILSKIFQRSLMLLYLISLVCEKCRRSPLDGDRSLRKIFRFLLYTIDLEDVLVENHVTIFISMKFSVRSTLL